MAEARPWSRYAGAMTPPRFEGFGPAVTDWFIALDSDNSRAYWTATKDVWQRDVRAPLETLLTELATSLGGRVKLFRPYRDQRFARGAPPMKTAAAGLVDGIDGTRAPLYLEVSERGLYAGTGYHQLATDQLARYRSVVAGAAGDALEAELERARGAGLTVTGEVLRGAPRGFSRDHPRIEGLRRKAVILGAGLPPGDALESRAPVEHALRVWATAAPVVAWLDAHVGPSELEREVRGRRRERPR
jgi:uncharacterized protein (TIGR02453 family)